MLIIRPARNFDEGERYIVALRNLKERERQGRSSPARGFRIYRDRITTGATPDRAPAQHFERSSER